MTVTVLLTGGQHAVGLSQQHCCGSSFDRPDSFLVADQQHQSSEAFDLTQ